MDVVVCVKPVPLSEQEITVREDGMDIKREDLKYEINEWDNYALEEALLLKEKYGGKVTVVTVSSEQRNPEFMIRECYAKGVDEAIMVLDDVLDELDAFAVSRVLYHVVKDLKFDLIFTGVQAFDDNYASTGATLASLLGVPHASIITKIKVSPGEGVARVNRELEGGLEEEVEVKLPALFTIQTGINQPRYASLLKIRMAMKKEIKKIGLEDLGLNRETILGWRRTFIRRMYIPKVKKETLYIKGAPEQMASKLVELLRDKGVLRR